MENNDHKPTTRVLDILEFLASNPDGLSLTEISNLISAPKSTILPIIRTMANRKFVFFNKSTYKYSIGINSFCIGSTYTHNTNILELIKKEMKYIVENADEICQMGILENDKVLYIAKVDSNNPIRIVSYVGKKIPAYCTALGKSLLCEKSLDELIALYGNNMISFTKNTITDIHTLYDELLEIKNTKISFEYGEINEETYCISTPLYKDQSLVAAISVSIPFFRMNPQKTELVKKLLLESKYKIEQILSENDIQVSQFLF